VSLTHVVIISLEQKLLASSVFVVKRISCMYAWLTTDRNQDENHNGRSGRDKDSCINSLDVAIMRCATFSTIPFQ
jgi:hypothetical protein